MATPTRYIMTFVAPAKNPADDVIFTIDRTPVGTFLTGSKNITPDAIGPLLEALGHGQTLESKGLSI